MANFEEIARQAKQKSQSILDEKEKAENYRKSLEVDRLEKAEKVLNENVLPVLMDAREAFKSDGVDLTIESTESYRLEPGNQGKSTKVRVIIFGCSSQLDSSITKSSRIRGDKYVFEADGSTIVGKPYGTSLRGDAFPGGTFPDYVAPFVSKALESYYTEVRRRR